MISARLRSLASLMVHAVLTCLILAGVVRAQVIPKSTYSVDLGSGAIAGTLPFDEPFVLSSAVTAPVREVRLWVGSRLFRTDCRRLAPPVADLFSGGSRSTDVDPRRRGVLQTDSANIAAELRDARVAYQNADAAYRRAVAVAAADPGQVPQRDAAREVLGGAMSDLADAVRDSVNWRVPQVPTSVWSRRISDSSTTLLLDVGAIEPNRDYTFCFELIRAPSAADSAAFVKNAAKSLGRVLRGLRNKPVAALAQLDSLQNALIDALPKADSIVISDPQSVFLRPASGTESPIDRRKRLSRLLDLYTDAEQGMDNAAGASAELSKGTGPAAEAALNALRTDAPTLRALGAADDTVLTKGRSARFKAAAALARQISFYNDLTFTYVARGEEAIDDRTILTQVPPATETMSTETLNTRSAIILRSAQQLDSIVRLAAFVASNKELFPNPALSAQALAHLRDNLNAAEEALTAASHSLGQVLSGAGQIDDAVSRLVESVTTLDFAHITLRGTTAMTYQARANTFISLDAGLMGALHVRSVVPYFGVNLYRVPVNKNMPLRGCACWSKRLALTLGVTAASIKEDNRIDDLFNTHAVLLGVGARVTDYFRLTGGALFAKGYPDGPNNTAHVKKLAAGAASLDIDIVNALGKIGTSLIPNLK